MAALERVNIGHQASYGYDDVTAQLAATVREEFGEKAEVFPVFNGTGANVMALTAAMPRWGAVIATETAHIHTDEGGAPERVSGLKLLTSPPVEGKLTPEGLVAHTGGRGDEHHAQPLAVSITQSTELGTVYSPDEIAELASIAHDHGMVVHLDGARIWNAAASLGLPFRAFTTDVGVDLVSLGATKNGAMAAEAVIVINPDVVEGMLYLRKFTMQLASKMRFISAQIQTLFDEGLGLRSATHANQMATLLRRRLEEKIAAGEINGIGVFPTHPGEWRICANAECGSRCTTRMRCRFYDWNRSRGEVRWMCSFDTTEDDITAFVGEISRALQPLRQCGCDLVQRLSHTLSLLALLQFLGQTRRVALWSDSDDRPRGVVSVEAQCLAHSVSVESTHLAGGKTHRGGLNRQVSSGLTDVVGSPFFWTAVVGHHFGNVHNQTRRISRPNLVSRVQRRENALMIISVPRLATNNRHG